MMGCLAESEGRRSNAEVRHLHMDDLSYMLPMVKRIAGVIQM